MFGLRFARAAALAFVFAAPLAAGAGAESAGPPVRVRGEIVKLEGDVLHVKDRSGAALAIKLAPNFRVTELRKADIAEIKAGSYIGVTALPQKDAGLKAIAVQ